ncbi:DUF2339 domain-containing protein [Xylanibacillus composti]|uniref:DUF2339 domain-containing protein n=1 Tax=Xylanibacillus composti TaxID=1572762 RepID=A0A8J4M3T2_9BACL|nr:DUF2339 domain-containing protein [Xylanibacillus composti]GIQ71190.1 hypothetical protein XYCOK13_40140 [Xylanibacillus composti]
MKFYVQKHWTTVLGILFVLAAFLYLFQFSVDQGWLTDTLKIAIGLLTGAGAALAGAAIFRLKADQLANHPARRLIGECLTGTGAALLYITFSFAGIYYALWDSMTVFLCMMAVTLAVALFAYRYQLRLLLQVALLGALLAPLVMRPETDQVFTLFLYLFVLNTASFFVSIRKDWLEARLLPFGGTWLLYTVYFFHFEPPVDGIWSMPFRYAVAAYLFYLIALGWSSWKKNKQFEGLNMYAGIVNAVLFGLWSLALLDGFVPYSVPLAAMGMLYLIYALILFKLTKQASPAYHTKLAGGLFLLLIAASQLGTGSVYRPLIGVMLWSVIAGAVLIAGQKLRMNSIKAAALGIWVVVGLYWFVVTWDTPRVDWFGVYVPFFNWGAFAWILLAVIGFYASVKVKFDRTQSSAQVFFSRLTAFLSHLVVGGLLTVQVNGLYHSYDMPLLHELALSITWGIYALLLFLWGAYSQQRVFRYFGSTVLVMVALKALLFDLSGTQTIYKALTLLILGGISFTISAVNAKWSSREQDQNDKETQEDTPSLDSGES